MGRHGRLQRDDQAQETSSSLRSPCLPDSETPCHSDSSPQVTAPEVNNAGTLIDRLISLRNYGDYVLLSLHEALKKVGRELYKVLELESFAADRPRLQTALDRVTKRYNELSEAAGPESVDQP